MQKTSAKTPVRNAAGAKSTAIPVIHGQAIKSASRTEKIKKVIRLLRKLLESWLTCAIALKSSPAFNAADAPPVGRV